MSKRYTNLTKADLIARIEELEAEKKKSEIKFSSYKINALTRNLKDKTRQVRVQKDELLELEESRNKYAELYDFSPAGYLTLNGEGIISEINLTALNILRVEKETAVGLPFYSLLQKSDEQKFKDFILNCTTLQELAAEEFTLINKSIIQVHVLPFDNPVTKEKIFKISIQNVTEKRVAENLLQESELRFKLMADSAPVMIWMTNADNQLEYMNKTKLKFLGKKFKELTNEEWLNTRHPEDREKFINELTEAAKERKNFTTEIRVMDKHGEYKWLLDAAAPRFLPDGTFAGFIGSGLDVTERKLSRIKLEKSLQEKEVLLKEIHHRVKNNLQVVSSLLNMQSHYINDESMLDIFRSSQNRIIAMALLHEKLYSTENLASINFRDYIKTISSTLLKTYQQKVQDIRIKVDVESIQLGLDISINFGLIINELVSNSLKHAFRGKKDGEIFISLNHDDNNNLILSVSDNGIGLPENFNVKETNSLGLILVSSIVEQLKGELKISKNGITEFKITIPDIMVQ